MSNGSGTGALIWHYSYVEKGLKLHRYLSSKCQGSALKSRCTPSTERRVRRWGHEAVLEEMQFRLGKAPEMMQVCIIRSFELIFSGVFRAAGYGRCLPVATG